MKKTCWSWTVAAAFVASAPMVLCAQSSQGDKVEVKSDGRVYIPAQSVPESNYLSVKAKAYLADHLRQVQDPEAIKQDHGVPRFMKPYLERQKILYPVNQEETKLGNIPVFVYTPKQGIAQRNKKRVLIELHGGGFSGCWPGCAELESIPLASLARMRVVAVNYREAPEYVFPAASEDVASVYRELLKHYQPKNIGIYGCSAGGLLTAMSVAWFQQHQLPAPGAIGIFCSSVGGPMGGDADYTALPLGEAKLASPMSVNMARLDYFKGANMDNPMVAPVYHPDVLKTFPPTLLISGTRDFALSGALYGHQQLVKSGVDAELYVWEGLFHGFFYNPDVPESRDAYAIMVHFFDKHLGR